MIILSRITVSLTDGAGADSRGVCGDVLSDTDRSCAGKRCKSGWVSIRITVPLTVGAGAGVGGVCGDACGHPGSRINPFKYLQ